MERRLRDRGVEEADDERARQKALEQLAVTRRRLQDEGNSGSGDQSTADVEAIILQMEMRMQEHLRKRLDLSQLTAASAASQQDVPGNQHVDGSHRRRRNSPSESGSVSASHTPPHQSGFVTEDSAVGSYSSVREIGFFI